VLDLHDNYKQFAPPHSYINALDFPSVKELADYLSLLDKNDTLYNQYFWWKEHYEIRNNPEDFRHGLCRLCSILHEKQLPSKSYDLTDWWDTKAECRALRFDNKLSNDPSYCGFSFQLRHLHSTEIFMTSSFHLLLLFSDCLFMHFPCKLCADC